MTFLLVGAATALVLAAAWWWARAGGRSASPRLDLPEPATIPLPPLDDPPWAGTAIELPVALLRQLAPPGELADAERDNDRIASIMATAAATGVHTPLRIIVSDTGRCRLEDGLHRLIASYRLGIPYAPVVFTTTDHIPGWALPVHRLVSGLRGELLERGSGAGYRSQPGQHLR